MAPEDTTLMEDYQLKQPKSFIFDTAGNAILFLLGDSRDLIKKCNCIVTKIK